MDSYEKLRLLLDAHPSGAPKSESFDEILRLLFSPEEAAVAAAMGFSPRLAETIAAACGIPAETAEGLLERMADRAVVFCREKEGKRAYALMPTIPGLFEFPFMKIGGTPMDARLGKLWEEYHADGLGASFGGSSTPLARVVPVGEALDLTTRIHPYEEVAHLIDEAGYIALGACACRISVGACDAPREVCLIFEATGRFLVQRGYAREISREEAKKVLDSAEEAGLVHTSGNSQDRATFICNCCPCCCTILRGLTQLKLPHAFATSGFQAEVSPDSCNGCGVCADERCPVGAIALQDDIAVVTPANCIGCGLCVTACPTEALSLVRREPLPEIPATAQEMGMKVLTEKGKLEAFLLATKR
ncbi:MAG: 4Fe-4S binding protein [Deltaproteobacteria bacterium]|nr:4Fe-4S binding protein [Deltaproteobacteria bacterium]